MSKNGLCILGSPHQVEEGVSATITQAISKSALRDVPYTQPSLPTQVGTEFPLSKAALSPS